MATLTAGASESARLLRREGARDTNHRSVHGRTSSSDPQRPRQAPQHPTCVCGMLLVNTFYLPFVCCYRVGAAAYSTSPKSISASRVMGPHSARVHRSGARGHEGLPVDIIAVNETALLDRACQRRMCRHRKHTAVTENTRRVCQSNGLGFSYSF